MSKVYEIFGYRVSDKSIEAERIRKSALCPFMGEKCDGGGNRYLSQINLSKNATLKKYFGVKIAEVPSGICSLQLKEEEQPWIVCPRRLLTFDKKNGVKESHQKFTESKLLSYSGYPPGTRLGIWSEVKIKFTLDGKPTNNESKDSKMLAEQAGTVSQDDDKTFDYTFDYVLVPLGSMDQDSIVNNIHIPWKKLKRILEKSGFSMAIRGDVNYVEDFPIGTPLIVEIMTSSTSGGDKKKRTTIPMAFEDALLGKDHNAPGINYRQVWARMVSQLIVKSEVAIGWGGKTFWVLQDVLVDYISSSTKLNLAKLLAATASEVNILSLSYGDAIKEDKPGILELKKANFYAGPISSSSGISDEPSFEDIIHVSVIPPISKLLTVLAKKSKVRTIVV